MVRVLRVCVSKKKKKREKMASILLSVSPQALQRIHKTAGVYKHITTVYKPTEAVD